MPARPSPAVPSLLVRVDRRFCRPCGRDVTSRPRARLAGVGIGAVIALVLALIGFSALIGPFIMFTVPFILLAGFAIGPLAGLAAAPPLCAECGRELLYATRESARATAHVARASAGILDMKAA